MQVTVSAANMWVTIFIVIMQMGVSVTIMQVVFSAVHYAHDFQVKSNVHNALQKIPVMVKPILVVVTDHMLDHI